MSRPPFTMKLRSKRPHPPDESAPRRRDDPLGDAPDRTSSLPPLLRLNDDPDGLPSARADAKHLATLFETYLHFDELHILLNTAASNRSLQTQLDATEVGHLTVYNCEAASDVLQHLTNIAQGLAPNVDLVVEFSSHGFCSGKRNYIVWNETSIWDTDVHKALVDPLSRSVRCVVLADMCSCGEWMVLNYLTTDMTHVCPESTHADPQHPNIVCISAVSDNEADMNNISDEGWGGGLTSAWIDYHLGVVKNNNRKPSIGAFFQYYRDRIKETGNTPVLSFNNLSFL
jgi:hypothetical protein